MRASKHTFIVVMALLIGTCGTAAYAQQASPSKSPPTLRAIPVYVMDIYHEPVEGVVLSNQGEGSQSAPTDNSGRTYIGLPIGTQPHDRVSLQLVGNLTKNEEWEIVGDDRIEVPPFDNKPDSYVTVVLIRKSDKRLLVYRNYLNVFGRNSSWKSNPDVMGKEYQPETMAFAIRALQEQEREIARQKVELSNTLLSLAQSLYSEGKYQEAIDRCSEIFLMYPDHLRARIQLALAFVKVGRYTDAEIAYERILRAYDAQEMGQSELVNVLESYLIVLRRLNRDAKVEEIETRIKAIRAKPVQQE